LDSLLDDLESETNVTIMKQNDILVEIEKVNDLKENPCYEVLGLLEEWASEKQYSHDELLNYAGELWVTRAQFEKDLKKIKTGSQLKMEKAIERVKKHMEYYKRKSVFLLEANEVMLLSHMVIESIE